MSHLTAVITQIKSDIAMRQRLLSEAETDDGRAYQEEQLRILERQLEQRLIRLAAE